MRIQDKSLCLYELHKFCEAKRVKNIIVILTDSCTGMILGNPRGVRNPQKCTELRQEERERERHYICPATRG
jgi:hypothetical protein